MGEYLSAPHGGAPLQESPENLDFEYRKEGFVKEDQYEAAKRDALQVLKEGYHLGGRIKWKREDLYDR